MNKKEIEAAKIALQKAGFLFPTLWCLDDIIFHAKDMGIEVTKKQAREIGDLIRADHDASVGINWYTISMAITHYFEEPEPKKDHQLERVNDQHDFEDDKA